jgi:transcriptional regulator with GAF, ATPase, and Fis domain
MTNNIPKNSDSAELLDNLIFINNLINKICGLRETNHIMESIIVELVAKSNADQGTISLLSGSCSSNLSTVVRVIDKSQKELPYQLGIQLIGWMQKNKTLLRIDDLDSDPRFNGLNSHDGKYKSLICYPMIVRGDLIGMTSLIRSVSKSPFTDSDCRLLGILVPQSSQILFNTRLLEDLAKTNELLELSRNKLKDDYIRLQIELKSSFAHENIVGKSSSMKKVMVQVSKYCSMDSPILITGETGTGKDLIAQAIHYNSDRKAKPFVVINCGLKTETLLESELFGHLRGSFTGAVKNKSGLFKEADGGTIFLDEIGDAPLSTQAAILRVIQNGEIRPLGSTKTEFVNVRVISATNKNLNKQMADGLFREDLFYRLSTYTIAIPPLRERRDDIPLLVNHFINKAKIKVKRETLSISPGALDILANYQWPGNIRELENEIERAAVTCGPSGVIEPADLSKNVTSATADDFNFLEFNGELHAAVEKVERSIIKKALAINKGNYTQTAKLLGLTRKGLMNKISRYKISIDFDRLVTD